MKQACRLLAPVWHGMRVITYVTLAVCATACDRSPAAPQLPDGIRKAVATTHAPDQSFYYYQGSKVWLTPDSDQLVVQSTDAHAVERAQSASQTLGLALTDGGSVLQARGHRLLHLSGRTSLAAFGRLRALLHADPAFTFVSPVFHTEDDHSLIEPVNRVAVRFRDGVSGPQVDALLQKGTQL
jgi:hypothetical protein